MTLKFNSWRSPVLLGLVLLFNTAGCDAQLEQPSTDDSTLVQASQPLLASVCGNGLVEEGETCDDRDTDSGDGCSATCAIEPGYSCHDAPSLCSAGCGNGTLGEGEQCDDADTDPGDGCSATCTVEPGYVCAGTPLSTCTVTCGDGIKATSEACDDGNRTNGDGCSSACAIETAQGYGCQNTGKSFFYSRLGKRDCTNTNLVTPNLPATAAQPALSTPDRYRIRYVAGAVSYSGGVNWFPGIFGVNPTGGTTTGAFALGYNPPGSSPTWDEAVKRAFASPLVKDFDAPSGDVRVALIDTDCVLLNNSDNAVFYRVDALSICQLIPVITTPAEGATSSGTISGTATPGSTVKVYVDGSTTPACTATTAANGTWTCAVPGITEVVQRIVARSTILSATENSVPRTFVGDITPPDTTIPVKPPPSGTERTGRFEYASPGEPAATFQCSLDGGEFVPCEAQYTVEPGPHTLRVRAVDPAGNVDPTPAEYSWTVVDDTRTFAGGGCTAMPGPSLVSLLALIALRRRNRR